MQAALSLLNFSNACREISLQKPRDKRSGKVKNWLCIKCLYFFDSIKANKIYFFLSRFFFRFKGLSTSKVILWVTSATLIKRKQKSHFFFQSIVFDLRYWSSLSCWIYSYLTKAEQPKTRTHKRIKKWEQKVIITLVKSATPFFGQLEWSFAWECLKMSRNLVQLILK